MPESHDICGRPYLAEAGKVPASADKLRKRAAASAL